VKIKIAKIKKDGYVLPENITTNQTPESFGAQN
jgi:hypothetical protein